MEYATTTKPRKPPKRAPVSPSSVCRTCRAFYQTDTRLDSEYEDVIRGFPREMATREGNIHVLRGALQVWDEEVKATVSPDIVAHHLLRKQRVAALLHDGFKEERRCVERCVRQYNSAVDHHRHVAKQKLPVRPPPVKKAPQQQKDTHDTEHVEDESFRELWFHQNGTSNQRPNMVDEAEECVTRVRAVQFQRLQQEQQALAAELRADLISQREMQKNANTHQARRIASMQSRESVASTTLLARHSFEADGASSTYRQSGTGGTLSTHQGGGGGGTLHRPRDISRISPTELRLKPAQRTLGDSAFWVAASRAQALPDSHAITHPLQAPEVKTALLASANTPAMASPAEMEERSFLEGVADAKRGGDGYGEVHRERWGGGGGGGDSGGNLPRTASTLLPSRGGGGGEAYIHHVDPKAALRDFPLPPHPLTGAAARLHTAQRQINEGMNLG